MAVFIQRETGALVIARRAVAWHDRLDLPRAAREGGAARLIRLPILESVHVPAAARSDPLADRPDEGGAYRPVAGRRHLPQFQDARRGGGAVDEGGCRLYRLAAQHAAANGSPLDGGP